MKIGCLTVSNDNVFRCDGLFDKGSSFGIIKYNESECKKQRQHSHEFIEICYIISGSGFHKINNSQHEVKKGDLFIIDLDMKHYFFNHNNKEDLVTYNIMFKPDFLDENLIAMDDFISITESRLFKNFFPELAPKFDLRLSASRQHEFENLIEKIYLEHETKESGYLNIIKGNLLILLTLTLRYLSEKDAGEIYGTHLWIVKQVMLEIEGNYESKLKLRELSKKFMFSKGHICNIFKKATGKTLSEYINDNRIKEACRLMQDNNLNLSEICLLIGFCDYKAFYTTFKKITGKTPNEYRKSMLTR